MSNRALLSGWNSNQRILEDVFEALLGAVYLDAGLPSAMRFFTSMVDKYMTDEDVTFNDNFKDILSQMCKQRNSPPP